MSDNQTISIPSLILIGVLSALAVRYFFFAPTSQSGSGAGPTNSRQVSLDEVERIAIMFPQIPRRHIMWDLQRSGGSVRATTERILGRDGLETPPPTFQPAIPSLMTTPSSVPRTTTLYRPRFGQMDLIKRYDLSDELSNPAPSTPGDGPAIQQQTWSPDKHERQALLQKRRGDMILKARRRMEQEIANTT
ncbi:MAG: hypothetical protein Q9163_000646 [Psora crenata]